MSVTSFYPVLMARDVAAAAAFYRDVIGFDVVFDSSWYVSMQHGAFELAIVEAGHETIPQGYSAPSQGLLLNLEVDNVDDVHQRLTTDHDLKVLLPLRSEEFGQRHFIVEAPGGILLDVIQPIEPTGEFAAAYVGDAISG